MTRTRPGGDSAARDTTARNRARAPLRPAIRLLAVRRRPDPRLLEPRLRGRRRPGLRRRGSLRRPPPGAPRGNGRRRRGCAPRSRRPARRPSSCSRAHIELAKAEIAEIAGEIGRALALGTPLSLSSSSRPSDRCRGALFLERVAPRLPGLGDPARHALCSRRRPRVRDPVGFGVPSRPARHGRSRPASLVAVVLSFVLELGSSTSCGRRSASDVAGPYGVGYRPLVIGLFVGVWSGFSLGTSGRRRGASAGGQFTSTACSVAGGVSRRRPRRDTAIPGPGRRGDRHHPRLGDLPRRMHRRHRRTGIDVEDLKARFYPDATIETSKETLEWLQRQMPPGTGS